MTKQRQDKRSVMLNRMNDDQKRLILFICNFIEHLIEEVTGNRPSGFVAQTTIYESVIEMVELSLKAHKTASSPLADNEAIA